MGLRIWALLSMSPRINSLNLWFECEQWMETLVCARLKKSGTRCVAGMVDVVYLIGLGVGWVGIISIYYIAAWITTKWATPPWWWFSRFRARCCCWPCQRWPRPGYSGSQRRCRTQGRSSTRWCSGGAARSTCSRPAGASSQGPPGASHPQSARWLLPFSVSSRALCTPGRFRQHHVFFPESLHFGYSIRLNTLLEWQLYTNLLYAIALTIAFNISQMFAEKMQSVKSIAVTRWWMPHIKLSKVEMTTSSIVSQLSESKQTFNIF